MEDKLTLVVMAAGMGSRFGGLKQITSVDSDDNFLLDYSVYDAIKAGFSKVVFIIKEENFDVFKDTVGKRIEDKIEVDYAFQDMKDIPDISRLSDTRVKPWGTAQAVLCARDYVPGSFAVINADDFYGYDSYDIVAKFLRENNDDNTNIVVPYPFNKVDSKYGSVKRGVLEYKDDNVERIIECSVGYEDDGRVLAKPLNGEDEFYIEADHPVSMNMFGFKNKFFDYLDKYFKDFFANNDNDFEKGEALLPECILENLVKGNITLKYQTSSADWLGMTYKEDLESVVNKLEEKRKNGEYPQHLWK